jgi:hypothetical protein
MEKAYSLIAVISVFFRKYVNNIVIGGGKSYDAPVVIVRKIIRGNIRPV